MGLASAVGRVPCQQVDGAVFTGVRCPRRYLIWRERSFRTWSQTKRTATESFRLVNWGTITTSFDDHPQLVQRATTVLLSAPSLPLPVTWNGRYSLSLKIVANYLLNPVYTYLATRYSPSSLLLTRRTVLRFAIPNITLRVAPDNGPTMT